MKTLKIKDRLVGQGHRCFVVAEIGTNHNRDLSKAKQLVRAAVQAGADAVKFQIYEADDIVNHRIQSSDYGLEKWYPQQTMHQVFHQYLRTPREWFPELSRFAEELGVLPLATAHSCSGAEFIMKQEMGAIKIASMDFNNLPLLKEILEVAQVPLLLSTGMSTLNEIEETVQLIQKSDHTFAMLHSVSNYPAAFEDLHLQNIKVLQDIYQIPIGFSDHTSSPLSSAIAVALGATIIEKHITLDRRDFGPDHPFALEPPMFKEMVDSIRKVESAFDPNASFTGPSEREQKNLPLYRRSLVSTRDIRAGETISKEDLKITRPGNGILPKYLDLVIGRIARCDIQAETLIQWEMI